MTTPAITPQQDWFSANAPAAQTDWFAANSPPPQIQKPSVDMQEDPLGKAYAAKEEVGQKVAKGVSGVANDLYDVSAPGIAEQIYRHMKGMPNKLDQIPGKMVLGFLTAGGLGPEIEAASAKGHAEETIGAKETPQEVPESTAAEGTAAKESAEDFVKRQTAGRATGDLKPRSATYIVWDKGNVTELPKNNELFSTNSEGVVHDLRTAEQKAASQVGQPEAKPEVWQRGPKKGQVKTYKVFDQGKWIEVPKYNSDK